MLLNATFIKSVLTLYDEMSENGLSLVYLGEFNHEITKMFTKMAQNDMDRKSTGKSAWKKLFHVIVETLQNLNKHSDAVTGKNIGNGLYIIGEKNDTYYVITSNQVEKEKKATLKEAIDEVNNATATELKEKYMKQMKYGKLSKKGGAGLGLIDIARKTNQKLDYQFLPLDEDFDLFILKVEVRSEG